MSDFFKSRDGGSQIATEQMKKEPGIGMSNKKKKKNLAGHNASTELYSSSKDLSNKGINPGSTYGKSKKGS